MRFRILVRASGSRFGRGVNDVQNPRGEGLGGDQSEWERRFAFVEVTCPSEPRCSVFPFETPNVRTQSAWAPADGNRTR